MTALDVDLEPDDHLFVDCTVGGKSPFAMWTCPVTGRLDLLELRPVRGAVAKAVPRRVKAGMPGRIRALLAYLLAAAAILTRPQS